MASARVYPFPNQLPPRYPPPGGFLLVPDLPLSPGALAGFPATPAIPPHVATGDIISSAHENQFLDAVSAIWGNVEWLQANSQTPWASNIDAAQHALNNVVSVTIGPVTRQTVLSVAAGPFTLQATASYASLGMNLHLVPYGAVVGAGVYLHNSSDLLNYSRLQFTVSGAQALLVTRAIGVPATLVSQIIVGEQAGSGAALTNIQFQFNGVVSHTFTPTRLGVANAAPACTLDVTGDINASATIGVSSAGKQTVIISTDPVLSQGQVDFAGNFRIGAWAVPGGNGVMEIQPSLSQPNGLMQIFISPAGTGNVGQLSLLNSSDRNNRNTLTLQAAGNQANLTIAHTGSPPQPITAMNIGETSGPPGTLAAMNLYFAGAIKHAFTPTSLGVGNAAPAFPLDVTGDINASGAIRLTGAGKQTVIISTDATFGGGQIELPGCVRLVASFLNGSPMLQPSSTSAQPAMNLQLVPFGTATAAGLYLRNSSDLANYGRLQLTVAAGVANIVIRSVGVPVTSVSSMVIGDQAAAGSGTLNTIALQFNGVAQFTFNTDGSLAMPGLPAANPGAGSKKLWYDPADGNRVKFAN